jgi:serine/threonine protein kinase
VTCPGEDVLDDFLNGRCAPAEREGIERHLDNCQRCFATVAALVGSDPVSPPRAARSEPALQPGARLAGHYEIRSCLGQGSAGIVYRALDHRIATEVALKVLRPELMADPAWEVRFVRELRIARQLHHPNVCRVYDLEESGSVRFLVLELATGGSLRTELSADLYPARPLADRLAALREIVSGVEAIHGAGIVHRDLKPENVLRTVDGRLMVCDLGLATIAADGATANILVGTPAYMAPEVARGERATPASDVWSLGMLMHEILFGLRPIWLSEGNQQRVGLASPRHAGWQERQLIKLCESCLSFDVARRPADGAAVSARFEPIFRGAGPGRARRWALGAGALAAVGALVAIPVGLRRRVDGRAGAPGNIATLPPIGPRSSPPDRSGSPAAPAIPPIEVLGPDDSGFSSLYDGTPAMWRKWIHVGDAGFAREGAAIVTRARRGQDMGLLFCSDMQFDDFVLRFEFQTSSLDDESGVFLRFRDPRRKVLGRNGKSYRFANPAYVAVETGFEWQIDERARGIKHRREADGMHKKRTGAIYDIPTENRGWIFQEYAPPPAIRPGQWYAAEALVRGQQYQFSLSGRVVTRYRNTDGYRGRPRSVDDSGGFVGLQSVLGRVAFRNIRARALPPS